MTARPDVDPAADAAAVVVTASPVPAATFPWVDEPKLSIVTVTYGTGRVLDRCVGQLAAALAADGLDAEVIAVDNPHPVRGSAAGDRLCIGTNGIRLVRAPENLGFGGGNNLGVRVARAGLICLLNPDVFVRPGELRRLVDAATAAPDAIVAPGFLHADGTVQELGSRLLANGETRPFLESGSHEVDYASAACWLLHRQVYVAVGGFDPVFHPAYYEDVDFVLRARERGVDLEVVDDVRLLHAHQSSTSEPPDVTRQREAFMARWSELLGTRPPT